MIINVRCKGCGHEGMILAQAGEGIEQAMRNDESTRQAVIQQSTRFYARIHVCEHTPEGVQADVEAVTED